MIRMKKKSFIVCFVLFLAAVFAFSYGTAFAADVVIEPTTSTSDGSQNNTSPQTVFINDQIGYSFFVDNTNTTLWELAPYYRLAEIYAKEVTIIEMDCPFSVAFQRNVHSVPENTVRQMYHNLQQERLPNHYKRQFIFT